ncbi:MAG: hypothetical protein JWO76_3118, partial [Nocardioides sp.]|nr:hypothetical protein [Nocardioides sp.]
MVCTAGFFLCSVRGVVDPAHVTVFLDWQNVYNHAREAFHTSGEHHTKGQVDPVDLAEVLTARIESGKLTAIRIYRGMPDNAYDPHGYAAARRQQTAWQRDPRVIVTNRNLRYPDGYIHRRSPVAEVKEKGIDVALALDLVTMATDGAYDLAILMSCDHDLAPAVERVVARRATRGEGPEVAVASWKKNLGKSPRMWLTRGNVFCHWLDQQDYWGMTDERN